MPLTKAQGLLLSNDELLAHLLENEAKRIQLAERLPFYPINGDRLRVERSSAADFGAEPLFDTCPVAVTEGVAVPTASLQAEFELKLLVQDVIVNDCVEYLLSNVNSQVGVQLESGMRRMLYRYWKAFGTGDTSVNPQEFSGVRKLTPSSGTPNQTIQPVDTTNGFLDLIDLARLVQLIRSNNGRPHVLWGNAIAHKNIMRAYFEKGIEPEYVMLNVPDSNGGMTQRACLAFQGVPFYIDEQYPTSTGTSTGQNPEENFGGFTSNCSSIYAMVLGRGGVYGIVPAAFGKKMIRVKEVLVGGTAQTTYRVYWPVSLCLEKQDGIARLQFRAHSSTL